jgi:hypothetical protein
MGSGDEAAVCLRFARLSIFHQDSPDKYTEIANIPTNGGKTSTYVPAVNQFFVIHPKTEIDTAGLLVYRVNR